MAARVRPSDIRGERVLVSLQHACSSLRYSSEGRRVKLVVSRVHLKNALAGVDSEAENRSHWDQLLRQGEASITHEFHLGQPNSRHCTRHDGAIHARVF